MAKIKVKTKVKAEATTEAKTKLNTDLSKPSPEEKVDDEAVVKKGTKGGKKGDDVVGGTDQADDTVYSMGDLENIDDGTLGKGENEKILSQQIQKNPSKEEEDQEVWLDDVDVFASSDPFMEEANFDPDNSFGY